MHIAVIGLSHHTAPVEVRERLSITDETLPNSLRSLMAVQEVQEASILSTCNRLEIYTLLRQPDAGIAAMARFLSDRSGLPATALKPHLFVLHHAEAIDHLLRVAAGLDSLVLGEGQILAQVKKMARLGQEHKSTGPILGRLLNQAVSTGKRVRSETRLGKGAVSISSAAVELAQLKCAQEQGKQHPVNLGEETVAVVGCGRMGRLLVQHLAAKGCTALTLVNRTTTRAEALAKDFPQLTIRCVGLEQLAEELARSSMVFTSTAAKTPMLTRALLEQLTPIRRLKLFDIGVPRNVTADVAAVDGVEAYDVDDLEEVVARNREARQATAKVAEALLRQDAEDFLAWWDGLEAVPVLNRLRRTLDEVREQELLKALSRMGPDLSAREKNVVEALSKGIVNKVLHGPVTRLRGPMERQKRLQQLQVLCELFDLNQVETS
ncbi:MAG: glutamyl-tRNA reductase [Candidatus Synechococcus spongiarum 15L]|uniref:Glutamyl-tRNA reductase n=2 Tax=Candidatus Synechococcus spongiarum TaxID=431041 RepID=A0A1T1CRY8_9SYNE|nr:MAG: glutamyl-tRNA reductase [Candidatus Synechococcus spongiarum 15L]MCY4360077.1 glutamyl-tRNA reductase [Cyanobacteria bacterium MAG APA_bin_95]OOV31347.1 glutamyl-tRNA reductase [Candidatus Synechococcus spongiarum LMB bulk15M]